MTSTGMTHLGPQLILYGDVDDGELIIAALIFKYEPLPNGKNLHHTHMFEKQIL